MGWTISEDFHLSHLSVKPYLDLRLGGDLGGSFRAVDAALTAGESSLEPCHVAGSYIYYVAAEETARPSRVHLGVWQIRLYGREAGRPASLGWKAVSMETLAAMSPRKLCPERLARRITLGLCREADAWRAATLARHEASRRLRAALADGASVVFEAPLAFDNGASSRRFRVERRGRTLRFRAPDGALCRIPDIETLNPRVEPFIST